MDKIKRILIISSEKNLREVLSFCFDGWGYEVFLEEFPLADISVIKRISPDVIVVDVQAARKTQLHICQLLKDDFLTAYIPIITIINKRQLRQQLLEIRQGVDDYCIKPPDPLDLRIRIEMALKRAQYSYHTNTLTGLPGARILEDLVKEKIASAKPFSFCYVDIDNFKAFNDAYGYHKGDQAIMQTAYILYRSVKQAGNPDDFIGHIGGDDFVFITTPDKYKPVCESFILMFDALMPFHYPDEDRLHGYIIAKDRTRKLKKLPLMSLSIAVVNRTDTKTLHNTIEISDRVAEIKGYLKAQPNSKFMADRRNGYVPEDDKLIYENTRRPSRSYQPLGQIFVGRRLISRDQLDEALRIHWKRGLALGAVLKELGLVNDQQVADALRWQSAAVGEHSGSTAAEV
ncbi:MAG TPA: diguanylate cyclase [Candidatus Omnitrophota bacterium]|nr:diguanylate cyclase [Candidatus Omnitrophota bacterium]HQJ15729.1 diguanylate cyclase [Candidatus Omnitrophota bacterium]